MSRVTIYPHTNSDGIEVYLVADRGMWLPGGYDTERTARAAVKLDDRVLRDLNERVYTITGENRPITMADVEGAR